MSFNKLIVVAVFLLLAAVLVFGGCSKARVQSGQGREVAALVNGAKIYIDDVTAEYSSLAPSQKEKVSKSDALSFLIEREVLYQEAVRRGVNVTPDEVQQEFDFYLLAQNTTEAKLALELEAMNSSIKSLKQSLMKQVMINKLFDRVIPKKFVIRKEDALAVYNSGKFAELNLTFEQAEKSIVDHLIVDKQKSDRAAYIESLKAKADVLIVAVPS